MQEMKNKAENSLTSPIPKKGALANIKEQNKDAEEEVPVKQEVKVVEKRPHSPINKELLYMDGVEKHMKK
jgi:hypothetical protein